MTDGSIIYDDDGKEIKIFDVKDGHGIKLLMRAGIDVAIITARESQVVLHRAKNLGIDMVYQKAMDKVEAFNEILQKKQLSKRTTAPRIQQAAKEKNKVNRRFYIPFFIFPSLW